MTAAAPAAARPLAASGVLKAALAVITIAALIRLALAAWVAPPPDETYYWEWSRRLASGYFDHPPAIALLIRGGVMLFGATPLGVRLGAVIAGWAASLCVLLLARRLAGDAAALRAAIITSCIPLAAAGLMIATPDAPLLLTTAASLLALDHAVAEKAGSGRAFGWWVVAGLALGCGLASKYSAALLAPGVLLALLLSAHLRRHLTTPAPYIAVLVALLVFLPVLLWNARHDWVSFSFQIEHGLDSHRGSALRREGELLAGQVALVSPILFVLLAAAVLRSLRAGPPREFLLGVIAATIFLFFCIGALRSRAEANWQAPAYVPAIVLLAAYGGRDAWRRWVAAGCVLGGTMVAAIYLQAVVPFLPVSAADDPTARGSGWSELAARVGHAHAAFPAPPGNTTWIAGNRYQEASEIAFHLPTHPVTFSLNLASRPNQYDLWPSFQQRVRPGDNLILALDADEHDDHVVAELGRHFTRVRELETVTLRRGPEPRMRCRIWVMEGWR